MKAVVVFMCAVASAAASHADTHVVASHAVAWPGAIPVATHVKTIIPQQIKAFGYSTNEYINAIPTGYQPQIGYQIPLPGYHTYQPVVSAPFFPPNGFLYPSLAPAAPIAPVSPIASYPIPSPIAPISPAQPPAQNIPFQPAEQPAGDEDSAVIESADSLSNPQQSQPQYPISSPQPSLDSKNMPAFPQIPQQQFPFYPQIPQFAQPGSNFPPQQAEQQNPSFPQAPSQSFPSSDNSDKGLNDEDTISVESA